MNNSLKNKIDKISLTKDIIERQQIIENYNQFNMLDRDNAVKKIKELRSSDIEIATATSVELLKGSVPFEQCTNEQIIAEIKMQSSILEYKMLKMCAEEQK